MRRDEGHAGGKGDAWPARDELPSPDHFHERDGGEPAIAMPRQVLGSRE
jgi:hypothetical protein